MADARKQRLIMHSLAGSPLSSVFTLSAAPSKQYFYSISFSVEGQNLLWNAALFYSVHKLTIWQRPITSICRNESIGLIFENYLNYTFPVGAKLHPLHFPWIIVATASLLIALPCKILKYGFTLWFYEPIDPLNQCAQITAATIA